MFQNVSMLIPTQNRHFMLHDIVAYHAPLGMPIYIADDSVEPYDIRPLQQHFSNVHYYHMPHVDFHNRIQLLLQNVTTPFCVFRADRRHQCNGSLAQCLRFLRKNAAYTSASALWFWETDLRPYHSHDIWANSGELDDAVARVNSHAISFQSPFYNVQRTGLARAYMGVSRDVNTLSDNFYLQEYIGAFVPFFLGKTKQFSSFGGIVQAVLTQPDYQENFIAIRDYVHDQRILSLSYDIIQRYLREAALETDIKDIYTFDERVLQEAFVQYMKALQVRFLLYLSWPRNEKARTLHGYGYFEDIIEIIRGQRKADDDFLLQALQCLLTCVAEQRVRYQHMAHAFGASDMTEQKNIHNLIKQIRQRQRHFINNPHDKRKEEKL